MAEKSFQEAFTLNPSTEMHTEAGKVWVDFTLDTDKDMYKKILDMTSMTGIGKFMHQLRDEKTIQVSFNENLEFKALTASDFTINDQTFKKDITSLIDSMIQEAKGITLPELISNTAEEHYERNARIMVERLSVIECSVRDNGTVYALAVNNNELLNDLLIRADMFHTDKEVRDNAILIAIADTNNVIDKNGGLFFLAEYMKDGIQFHQQSVVRLTDSEKAAIEAILIDKTKELTEEKAIRAAAEKSEKQVTAEAPEKESTSEKQKTEPVRLPKEKG